MILGVVIHNSTPPKHIVVMSELDKFINIFEGCIVLTVKLERQMSLMNEVKHKTKSFIIKKTLTKQMFHGSFEW